MEIPPIPKQLQRGDFRFILIGRKNKIPQEKEWTTVNNYAYNDEKLLNHIKDGGNYGIIGGKGNLVIVDADCKQTQIEIDEKLPETFKVSTSSPGCYHNYYIIEDMDKKYVLDDFEDKHYGEIQFKGSQAVAPGSIHPTGKKYKANDIEIATITRNQIIKTLWPFFKEKDKHKILSESTIQDREDNYDVKEIKLHLKLKELMVKLGYDISKNPTMCKLGHASKGGSCFSYNDDLWKCFHCDEGGDIFNLIMLQEDLEFPEAVKRLGKIAGIEPKITEQEPEKTPMIRSLQEIFNKGIPKIEWRVKNLIPKRGTVIFGGTSGSYKTWAAMQLTLSCSIGKDFLEEFETEQCTVLYIDEENGDITIPARFDMLRKGHDYSEYFTNVFVSIFNDIKLDNPDHVIILRNLIKATGAKLVVIDSMVRCMQGEEDKSTDVRKIFDTVKPIMDENKEIAFVILHHTTKANNRNMASLRGSGDFAAFSDVILMFDTAHKGYFNMDIVKNRHIDMATLNKIGVKVNSDEKGVRLVSVGDPDADKDVIEKIIRSLKEWITLKKIPSLPSSTAIRLTQDLGFSRDSGFRAIKQMVYDGDLSRLGRGTYKVEFINIIEEYVG